MKRYQFTHKLIQIGNEITDGLLWDNKLNKHNYYDSIMYLNAAIDGINLFEKENNLDN